MITAKQGLPSQGMFLTLSYPPVGENVGASSVTTPAPTGPRAGIRLSNLDRNGRLVKRGCVVSYHGIRYQVHKVSRGWFWGRRLHLNGVNPAELPDRLLCEVVQVVGKAAPSVSRVGLDGAVLPL
jgi:hypothetical protein